MQNNHHVVGLRVYSQVFAALLVLTALTVGVAQVDFGPLNALLAAGIATIKALLVLLYFMHVKYDDKIYGLIFGLAMFFVFVLFVFIKFDALTRVLQEAVL